jgi:predicted Fe-Mo cluster-binding NifX family protein
MKHGVIGQLLGDVDWGDLDYLVIDAPPGTGDEPLSVCQLLPDADGAVVVTTPQDLSVADVRRSVGFCKQLGMRVLGVIENMSGFVCPKCGGRADIFKTGGGHRLAMEMHVPFLGAVPLEREIVEASDAGWPFVMSVRESVAARAFCDIVNALLASVGDSGGRPAAANEASTGKDGHMRFAIPMAEGKLTLHFGHSESFTLIDSEDGEIVGREDVPAPEHQPGLLPRWLAERGANVIIAGGMGGRALGLFAEQGIEVAVGAPREEPEKLVEAYLAGTLRTGENVCDH